LIVDGDELTARPDNFLRITAAAYPNKVATRFRGREMTDRERDQLASRAAHRIRALG